MKRMIAVVMTIIMLLGMTTISFAATKPKAAAPVFKFYSQFYFQGKGDYLNLTIQKEDKTVSMTHAEYSQDLKFTKITQGKVVTKGTTVWIFTGSCVLKTTKADTGDEILSKPFNTSVTITFIDAETVVAVVMPKVGAGKGENFKGIAGPPGEGY